MKKDPTVISLFAGCGGSSLGYKMAGFKELLAIDFDKNAVDTFRYNFPEVPVWRDDITKLKTEDILSFCNLKKGELDVLDGSPPCQGFSTAGNREVNDVRNLLFQHYVRILKDLSPKVFVMENVSGQIKGAMKGMFIEILTELKNQGYHVKAKLMNSMYYGVPQRRERLIYIGVRNDVGIEPTFPVPSMTIQSVSEALIGITPDLKDTWIPRQKRWLWKKLLPGEDGQKIMGEGKAFSVKKIDPNRPSPTILKSRGDIQLHWKEERRLSISELKAICSFPQSFTFLGSPSSQQARLGNAVMPKMMEAIARHIKESVL